MHHLVVVERGATLKTRFATLSPNVSIIVQDAMESAGDFCARLAERLERSDARALESIEVLCRADWSDDALFARRQMVQVLLRHAPSGVSVVTVGANVACLSDQHQVLSLVDHMSSDLKRQVAFNVQLSLLEAPSSQSESWDEFAA